MSSCSLRAINFLMEILRIEDSNLRVAQSRRALTFQVHFKRFRYEETTVGESGLLMLHIELLNNAWSILFAWIGTTTAMIGAAYFVAARIKISLVIAMLSLYGIFTAACVLQVFRTWGRILSIGKDLRLLQDSGVALTHSAHNLIANLDSQLVANFVLPLMLVVFVGSAIYVIYCYKGGGAS